MPRHLLQLAGVNRVLVAPGSPSQGREEWRFVKDGGVGGQVKADVVWVTPGRCEKKPFVPTPGLE